MVDVSNVAVVTMVAVAWRRESEQKKSGGGDDQEAEIDLSFSDSRSSTSYVNRGNSGGARATTRTDGEDGGKRRSMGRDGRRSGLAELSACDARLLYSGFAPHVTSRSLERATSNRETKLKLNSTLNTCTTNNKQTTEYR